MKSLLTITSKDKSLNRMQRRKKEFLMAFLAIILSFSLVLTGCNSGTENSPDGDDDGGNSI
ncbi:MAG: hypothetical protein GX815_14155, partial [Clostridiales bacterium]|nr:hypothetical protein [Clostridiales bacterium]